MLRTSLVSVTASIAISIILTTAAGCSGMQKNQRPPKHDPPIPVVMENPTLSERAKLKKQQDGETNQIGKTTVQGAVVE